jgi:hypothetical protein
MSSDLVQSVRVVSEWRLRYGRALACICLAVLPGLGGPTAFASSLTLTCELLSTGPNPSCPSTAPMYAVPGQYNYGNQFTTPIGSTPIAGSNIYGGAANGFLGSAGFIDNYFFNIAPAQADVVSATIDLGGVFSIGNLFARIYSLTANPGGLVTTTPVGAVDYGVITPSGPVTLVQINPVTLATGSYVLEISGTDTGSQGGSYTGTLNLSAVPLPGTLALLLSGLGVLFAFAARRSPAAAPGCS